jgi:hypothetical protein
MEILELLKKIKNIAPDSDYQLRSKALILSSPQKPKEKALIILVRALESGLAISLGAILLLIFLGGFSVIKLFSPYQMAGLNLNNMKVQAQDISNQIHLAELSYSFLGNGSSSNATIKSKEVPKATSSLQLGTSSQSSIYNFYSSLEVESALEKLSK